MNKLMKLVMKRFLNKGTLVAVASFVGMQLLDAGVIATPEALAAYMGVVKATLTILVGAGILNNAGVGKGFRDKE